MTLEQFAYLAEILAAIAVIASLVYVGYQLRQNTEALEAQSRYNLMDLRATSIDNLTHDRELLEMLHRYTAGSELTEVEKTAVILNAARVLEMWQWQHGEYHARTLPLDRLPVENWRRLYHERFIPNAIAEVWPERKGTMNPDFVKFMEENVVNER